MAILEAASCNLLVVSTKVGGIPEVLPNHMIILALPDEDHLTVALSEAIEKIQSGFDASGFHEEIKQMYSWPDVAERTEAVYLRHIRRRPRNYHHPFSLLGRMEEYYGCGEFLGVLACMLIAVHYVLITFLDWLLPPEDIDIAPDFSPVNYNEDLRDAIKKESHFNNHRPY